MRWDAFGSTTVPDMEWGDTGRLYFWVREADLQAGALDRAWCILQSH